MDFIKRFFGFYDLIEMIEMQKTIIDKQNQIIEIYKRMGELNDGIIKIQKNMISKSGEAISLQNSVIEILESKNKKLVDME